eukprot:1159917-Pelagomonas_calceolata.AAC.9
MQSLDGFMCHSSGFQGGVGKVWHTTRSQRNEMCVKFKSDEVRGSTNGMALIQLLTSRQGHGNALRDTALCIATWLLLTQAVCYCVDTLKLPRLNLDCYVTLP